MIPTVVIYFSLIGIVLWLFSFIEKTASLRGTSGSEMHPILDKSLRVTFLIIFVSPLLYLLPIWLVVILVLVYLPFYLDGSEKTGSRCSKWVQRWSFWSLIKKRLTIKFASVSNKIEKDRQYIIAFSPHGILPWGSIFAFFSNVANVHSTLPGLSIRCLAASFVFYIPIYRDFALAAGIVDASRYVAKKLLKNGSHSIALCPGGASEALYVGQGRHTLYLKNRLGFVRLAMQTGVPVIPVYSFGENNTYNTLNASHSAIHAIRNRFQRIFGISLPLITHVLPLKTNINIVFGDPIEFKRNDNPSEKELLAGLKQYMNALTLIWNKHKDEYAQDRIEEMNFI